MWPQIIFTIALTIISVYSAVKLLFTESEPKKAFYTLLLLVMTMFLAATTILLAIQLNSAREGCPELEVIQRPAYHIKE